MYTFHRDELFFMNLNDLGQSVYSQTNQRSVKLDLV